MTNATKWGEVKANGIPHENDPCPFSIGSLGVYDCFIKYFDHFFPKIPVFKGMVNRVGIDIPPLIIMQTIMGKRISTEETRYSDHSMFIKEFSKNFIRLDFYGSKKRAAADMAQRFRTIWNNSCTFDFFNNLNVPLFPLYLEDFTLRPFVNSEDQYSDHFICDAYYEYHPEIELPQESATEIIFPVALANNK
ncbi:hypothetical protein [Commensalibacter communis]|uniref:hypothetical protein n=1 Tax=Commensalibacter communis TaxID=2972786 RepID=UPI0022FFB0FB|nr:hypothetical protein [Commensalibacter communis]CAI3933404.1 unnamed protein product [Commensalibacter communis]CAI3944798.1 unnamed protein product [Commensalibacter communis]